MKKIGILGTGMVGTEIGTKLIELGYEVKIGSRSDTNKNALEWVSQNGSQATTGTFDDAAEFGEIIFLCVKGNATLSVIKSLQSKSVNGKTIIDITNPLDFSKGMPPFLIPEYANTNSLGEEVQKALKDANVVKTLNMVNCKVMINPIRTGEEPTMFISGNNENAKSQVIKILKQFGWKDIIDLGDIVNARGMEMLLPLWLDILGKTNNPDFGFKIVKK